MIPLLNHKLPLLAIIAFTSGCGPSRPAAAVSPVSPAGQVVALPQTASPEQVVSNLFQNALFQDGKLMVAEKIVMVDPKGGVLAQHSLHGRKVTTYRVRDMLWAIYDHGSELCVEVDTDLGRKSVYITYEAPQGKLPGGWRCRVETSEPITFPETNADRKRSTALTNGSSQ